MLPQRVIEELENKSKEYGTRRVLVQLPEGLKPKAKAISDELNSLGFEPIISADPCFGACDLRFLDNAITLHVGHSRMLNLEPVVYWEYRYDIDPSTAVEERISGINEERVGLATTVQHIGFVGKVKEMLEKHGKEVFIGKGVRTTYPGQVLGCDAGAALSIKDKVDSFVYIGSGVFHPLMVAYQTGKKVYAIDPFSMEMQVLTGDKLLKERSLRISKAMNAKSFGVVLSTKPGQYFPEIAEKLVKMAKKQGFDSTQIILDLITPDNLDYLGFDAYVITACPRIVIDDWKNYKRPVLLPDEFYDLLDM